MTIVGSGVAGFVFLVLWAAVADLRTMEIPNRISVALLAVFLVIAPFAGLEPADIGWHVLIGLVWFAIGVGLMAAGVMGGGDVKVAAAVAVWMGSAHSIAFLYYTGLYGGVLALLFLILRRSPLASAAAGRPWMARLMAKDEGIPYAVAIAAGALTVLPLTMFW